MRIAPVKHARIQFEGEVHLAHVEDHNAVRLADGLAAIEPGDRITVQRAPHTVRFVHPEGYSFFSTLRRKLHWNLMPQATDNVE